MNYFHFLCDLCVGIMCLHFNHHNRYRTRLDVISNLFLGILKRFSCFVLKLSLLFCWLFFLFENMFLWAKWWDDEMWWFIFTFSCVNIKPGRHILLVQIQIIHNLSFFPSFFIIFFDIWNQNSNNYCRKRNKLNYNSMP